MLDFKTAARHPWRSVNLGFLSAALTSLSLAGLLALHVLPTGFRPDRDAVSLYAAGKYRWLYQLEVVAVGGGAAFLVVALARSDLPLIGVIALSIFAASRIGIAAFPIKSRAEAMTPRIAVHLVLGAVAFVAMAAAAWTLTDSFMQPRWSQNRVWLNLLRWLIVLGAAGTFGSNSLLKTRVVLGLMERAWYAGTIGWLLVVGVRLGTG